MRNIAILILLFLGGCGAVLGSFAGSGAGTGGALIFDEVGDLHAECEYWRTEIGAMDVVFVDRINRIVLDNDGGSVEDVIAMRDKRAGALQQFMGPLCYEQLRQRLGDLREDRPDS